MEELNKTEFTEVANDKKAEEMDITSDTESIETALAVENADIAENTQIAENTEIVESIETVDPAEAEKARKEELKKQAQEKKTFTINLLAGVYLIYSGVSLIKGFFAGFNGVWDKDALIQSIFGVVFIIFGVLALYRNFGKKIIDKLKIYKKWSEEED